MDIGEIFGEQIRSGVFHLAETADLSRLSAVADEKKFAVYILDGTEFASKRGFIAHFAKVMKPPDSYVHWDYFERQLEVTEWLEKESGEVIIYKSIGHFYRVNRKDFDILLNIFLHVAYFRNQRPHLPSLLIFLQGLGPLDLHIPLKLVEM